MNTIKEILVLFFSFSFVLLWQNRAETTYGAAVVGIFALAILLVYLITSRKYRFNIVSVIHAHHLWSLFLLNSAILILILSTGSINSLLFFLLYFLTFSVAFAYNPIVILAFVTGAAAVFLPEALLNNVFSNITRFGTLVIIIPLAYFFGRKFRKEDETKTLEHKPKQ